MRFEYRRALADICLYFMIMGFPIFIRLSLWWATEIFVKYWNLVQTRLLIIEWLCVHVLHLVNSFRGWQQFLWSFHWGREVYPRDWIVCWCYHRLYCTHYYFRWVRMIIFWDRLPEIGVGQYLEKPLISYLPNRHRRWYIPSRDPILHRHMHMVSRCVINDLHFRLYANMLHSAYRYTLNWAHAIMSNRRTVVGPYWFACLGKLNGLLLDTELSSFTIRFAIMNSQSCCAIA